MGQIYIPALQADTHHLKVVINKPRQYRPAPGINDLHGAGDILRVALSHAQAGNLAALGQKPIGAYISIHTEDLPVFDEQVSLIHGICSHHTVFFTERSIADSARKGKPLFRCFYEGGHGCQEICVRQL